MLITDTKQLTAAGARLVLDAAVGAAESAPVSIAVVDAGGHLVTLQRLDGAPSHTVHSATTKGACAASMRKPTGLAGAAVDLSYGLGIALAAGPAHWTPLPGGMPLLVDGVCVGAVGVAGAPPEVDEHVAQAAAAALSRG